MSGKGKASRTFNPMLDVEMLTLGSGTSQGVPVIGCHCETCMSTDAKDKRYRSSVLFRSQGVNVLIDTGPDLRSQLLQQEVEQVDAVAYTHAHQDHTAGLDDLRPLIFRQNRPMPLYCTEEVEGRLRQQYGYIFDNADYPGVPKVSFHRLEGGWVEIAGLPFRLIHAWHGSLAVVGFRLGGISYLTDANRIDDSELEVIKGSDCLVLNALRDEPHYSHFHLEAAVEVGRKSGVPKVYFTHISHHFEPHAQLEKRLPEGFAVLYDGRVIRSSGA